MEISYYPTIHEMASYQLFTGKEHTLKTFRNVNALSRTWDKGSFKMMRQELIRGNVTLVISAFGASEPVVITRQALPVNDLYIFDLTLTEEEHMRTFNGETFFCKKDLDCCGFSTGTVQMAQVHNSGSSSDRVEIMVSRSYMLHFINELALNEKSPLYGHIIDSNDFFQIVSLGLPEAKLVQNLIDMYKDEGQTKKVTRILSTNLVLEILVKLLYRLVSKNETDNEAVRRSDFNKIMEVKKMMESRLDVKYRMDEVCNYCSMSVSKFKYLFKSVVGHSFSNYYTKIRMEEAVKQLESKSAENISQLSIQLGYKNLSEFTRTFKDYFQYPPSDFSKNQRD